jgi:hypothetical protein
LVNINGFEGWGAIFVKNSATNAKAGISCQKAMITIEILSGRHIIYIAERQLIT